VPRRILYNVFLVIEVVIVFVVNLPGSRSHGDLNLVLLLFVLAVLANIAYCACYVVDVAAQLSAFREARLPFRWALLVLGVAFAGIRRSCLLTNLRIAVFLLSAIVCSWASESVCYFRAGALGDDAEFEEHWYSGQLAALREQPLCCGYKRSQTPVRFTLRFGFFGQGTADGGSRPRW
jgi:hypothetical protein